MDDYETIMKKRPHVVLLGAGASCAALPKGDKYGKKISAMNGFLDTLGLSEIIRKIELQTESDNLEDILNDTNDILNASDYIYINDNNTKNNEEDDSNDRLRIHGNGNLCWCLR